MTKILIADDEQLIRKLIGDALRKDGYIILEAQTGIEAFELFKRHKDEIKLCILDIMMPDLDGWGLTKKIRAVSGVPVMLVSARSQEFDQILGFECGADDYVTKPFSLVVLKKRIDALLMRGESSVPAVTKKAEEIELDGLFISDIEHKVTIDGKIVEITLREFQILKLLCENIGLVYTREQLLDRILGNEYIGENRTIDSRIARLRTKLGDWGKKHIITIYGIGYKAE